MKKHIFILLAALSLLGTAKAQETPPAGLKSTNAQFYINLVDSAIWHQKGAPYGWERLARYKDIGSLSGIYAKLNGGNSFTGPQNNSTSYWAGTGFFSSSYGGSVIPGDASFGQYVRTSSLAADRPKGLMMLVNGLSRWAVITNGTAESGSNTGSNFNVLRYNDAGVMIDTVMRFSRATGIGYFKYNPLVNGSEVALRTGGNDIYGTQTWHSAGTNPAFMRYQNDGANTPNSYNYLDFSGNTALRFYRPSGSGLDNYQLAVAGDATPSLQNMATGDKLLFPTGAGTLAKISDLANYVDLTTNQTIGGAKTFTVYTNFSNGLQSNAQSNFLSNVTIGLAGQPGIFVRADNQSINFGDVVADKGIIYDQTDKRLKFGFTSPPNTYNETLAYLSEITAATAGSELTANKTATASSSTTTYPNWAGVTNALNAISPPKVSATVLVPDYVYGLCNDLQKTLNGGTTTLNYSNVIYVDHGLNFYSTGIRKKANWRSTKSDRLPVFAPVTEDNATYNGGVNVLSTTVADTLEGQIVDVPVSFTSVTTLLSSVASKYPKVLVIGDSRVSGFGADYPSYVTLSNPTAFWSYIKKLNVVYKALNGGTGFDYLSLGQRSSRSFIVDGVTYNSYAEGRGGWAVGNYLYDATGPNSYINSFYDGAKPGAVKFSIAKFLSDYKTLTDDGLTRLVPGSTAGTLVVNANSYDVCTPTHVVIELGFNDLSSDYQTNMPIMIAAIKAEFPNMIVIINIDDAAGTLYPENYPMFNYSSVNMMASALHDKMWNLVNFVKGLNNPANRVYACTNYFVQPTAWGTTTRDVSGPEAFANQMPAFDIKQRHNTGSDYHPSTYAHAAWAYQLDALIKYTSSLYL